MAIQFLLAHTGLQVISALHVVNGVLIFGVTLYLTRQAWQQATLPVVLPAQSSPAAAALKTS